MLTFIFTVGPSKMFCDTHCGFHKKRFFFLQDILYFMEWNLKQWLVKAYYANSLLYLKSPTLMQLLA